MPLGAREHGDKIIALVTTLAVSLLAIKLLVKDHDVLFLLAEFVHFIGIGFLAYKLLKHKNCAGLSLKSMTAHGDVFVDSFVLFARDGVRFAHAVGCFDVSGDAVGVQDDADERATTYNEVLDPMVGAHRRAVRGTGDFRASDDETFVV